MPTREKLRRPLGERRYRKMFIISAEGTKTEPQYFGIFNTRSTVVNVRCLKSSGDNSPPAVLKRMKEYISRQSLEKSDEAWVVVDKDNWTEHQLSQLHEWSTHAENHGFALSNPKFEYWLLLHFEDGTGVESGRHCSERLSRHYPDYDKSIASEKFTPDMIQEAVVRAKKRDNPPCADWPRQIGSTTVYKLVECILRSQA